MEPLGRIKARAGRAFQARSKWDATLRDVYDYVIPNRGVGTAGRRQGQQTNDHVYDATAIRGAWRFAGRLQQDLTPPGEPFFKLRAGPGLVSASKQKAKQINEQLEGIGAAVVASLSTANFDLAMHEMYFDLFAGTGAVLMLRGDDRDLIRCMSVAIYELALEQGPYSNIWGRHWKRSWPASQLEGMWPAGSFSDALRQQMAKEQDKPISICQSTVWDNKAQLWRLHVFDDSSTKKEGDREIWTEDFRVDPWITPRWTVVPGEVYGRGPAMFALPSVRSANKARELALKAAAFSLLGLWMRRQDSAFNPNTAKFEPGAMWQVSSTGGPLGPTIAPLEVPRNFDISHVIMQDEREQIKQLLFDETLPPDSGAVRSATEIMERMKRLSADMGGVLGRLTREIIQPIVQRSVNILAEARVLESDFTIDQLAIGLQVTSPISDSTTAAKAKKLIDYWSIISSMFGADMLPVFTKVEDAIPLVGRWLGVDETLLRSDEDAAGLQKIIERMVDEKVAQQMKGMPQGEAANGMAMQ